jgi:hypothetical protein
MGEPLVVHNPSRDSGDDPSRDSGEDPSRDSGDDPSRDSGDDPSRDSGDDPSRDSGDDGPQMHVALRCIRRCKDVSSCHRAAWAQRNFTRFVFYCLKTFLRYCELFLIMR